MVSEYPPAPPPPPEKKPLDHENLKKFQNFVKIKKFRNFIENFQKFFQVFESEPLMSE